VNVTRFATAPEYRPPNHFDMRCLRLQGHEAGPADAIWIGASVIEPGGRIDRSASALEKHYVVIEGEIVLDTGEQEVLLGLFDSCCLTPGEPRTIRNASARRAVLLIAMPFANAPFAPQAPGRG
jgi:quercetin dioxygenase-like cupin family protein